MGSIKFNPWKRAVRGVAKAALPIIIASAAEKSRNAKDKQTTRRSMAADGGRGVAKPALPTPKSSGAKQITTKERKGRQSRRKLFRKNSRAASSVQI